MAILAASAGVQTVSVHTHQSKKNCPTSASCIHLALVFTAELEQLQKISETPVALKDATREQKK